jgi:hypothetical protein
VLKKRMGRFAELVAEELEIACTGLGQTTWKRAQIARGLEADECYCFAQDKLTMIAEAMARYSKDVADDPNPDANRNSPQWSKSLRGGHQPTWTHRKRAATSSGRFSRRPAMEARPHGVKPRISVPSSLQEK